ncbi:hypothetical protein [Candidatus Enterovibrio escicola]|uniref:hypothetical protein n=1 Tax=Candidatus Enterovibrio escicola TaxID=1927127 RepID=UPI001237F342|nr:hypothetical protein [Candidatus Enterovibrio escacola]
MAFFHHEYTEEHEIKGNELCDCLIILRNRFISKTVFYQLTHLSQIEHSRHKCGMNFMVNLIGKLIVYSFQQEILASKSFNLKNNTYTRTEFNQVN